MTIVRILSTIPTIKTLGTRLQTAPGANFEQVDPPGPDWELANELIAGTEVMLCKFPPRNLDAITVLKFIQLSTVGYEHLRKFKFAARSLTLCNARGIFDS